MKRGLILAVFLTFLGISSAYAQWSGSGKADGAWNFRQSNSENADFKLKYTGRKFYAGSDMNYLKVVSTTPMHRAALLGVNFIF